MARVADHIDDSRAPAWLRRLPGVAWIAKWSKTLGPGLITGASDDDPSGIGTYSQAGAQLGFGVGWTMLLSYPLMTAIQEISARIGYVVLFGAISILAQIFFNYRRYVSILKWLTLSLFAYVIALVVVKVPLAEALR